MGDFWSGLQDNFSNLADSYLKFRTAEAQADAVGAGQAQLNTQVEQSQGNGQVPLNAGQLQNVASGATGGFGGLSTNQMMLGGLGLVALLLLKK